MTIGPSIPTKKFLEISNPAIFDLYTFGSWPVDNKSRIKSKLTLLLKCHFKTFKKCLEKLRMILNVQSVEIVAS